MASNIGRKIEDYASKHLRELKQQEAKTGKKFTKYDIAIFMIQNGQLSKTEFAGWMNTREGFDAQTLSKQQEQALKRGSVFGFAGYGGGEESYLDSLIPFSEKSDIEKFNIMYSPNKGLRFGATKAERAKRDKEIKTEIKQQKVKQQILNPKKAAEEKKLIHHLDSLPEVKKEYDEIMAEIKAQDEASMSHDERKKFIMSKFLKAWNKGEKLEMMSALEEFNSYMCSYIDDKLGITDAKESIKEKVHLNEAVEAINKYVDDGNDETITFAEGAWEFMKGLGDAADSLIGAQGVEMAGVFGAAGKAIQASGKFAPVLGGLMKTYFGAEASKLLGESASKMLGAEKKEDFREAGTDAAFGVMMAHGTVSGLGGIKGSKAAEIANKKALADARKTLGLAENVEITPELLKQAYKSASLKNHPDKGGSTEAFQKVQDAYELLKGTIELDNTAVNNSTGHIIKIHKGYGFTYKTFGNKKFQFKLNQDDIEKVQFIKHNKRTPNFNPTNLTNELQKFHYGKQKIREILKNNSDLSPIVGKLPQQWGKILANKDGLQEIDNLFYDVSQKFYDKKLTISDVKTCEDKLSEILQTPAKIEVLGEGQVGFTFKITVNGQKYVLKCFKDITFEGPNQDVHGNYPELSAAIYASKHDPKHFAKFYFGRFGENNNGYIVTKFVENATGKDATKFSFTECTKLMYSGDTGKNAIGSKIIDYGDAHTDGALENFSYKELKILRTLANALDDNNIALIKETITKHSASEDFINPINYIKGLIHNNAFRRQNNEYIVEYFIKRKECFDILNIDILPPINHIKEPAGNTYGRMSAYYLAYYQDGAGKYYNLTEKEWLNLFGNCSAKPNTVKTAQKSR